MPEQEPDRKVPIGTTMDNEHRMMIRKFGKDAGMSEATVVRMVLIKWLKEIGKIS